MTVPVSQTDPSQASSPWREVTGTVLRSEVIWGGEFYHPVVHYEYEVEGVVYRGDTIVAGLVLFNWKGPARRWVARFPVGARIPVFVDRSDPSHAVLQTGHDAKFPIFAVAFGALAVILLVIVLVAVGQR